MFPALFLGIAVAEFARTWFDVSPTLAVAVGAAAAAWLTMQALDRRAAQTAPAVATA